MNHTCDDGLAGEGICVCLPGFSQPNCTNCRNGYFGFECEACPDCGQNGVCHDGSIGSGDCICDNGWGGENCQLANASQPWTGLTTWEVVGSVSGLLMLTIMVVVWVLLRRKFRNTCSRRPKIIAAQKVASVSAPFPSVDQSCSGSPSRQTPTPCLHRLIVSSLTTKASQVHRDKTDAIEDIFLSFRFGEAMDEARELRNALRARGLYAYICEIPPGKDIVEAIVKKLSSARLVVILGTQTYGCKGSVYFSTREELKFVIEEEKPIFLIKMCNRFQDEMTRFQLPDSMSFAWWTKGDPLPASVVDDLEERYLSLI